VFRTLGVHWDSNSQSGSSLGSVEVHSLPLSCTHGSMQCDSRAHSWPAPLQAFFLVASPRLGCDNIRYILCNNWVLKSRCGTWFGWMFTVYTFDVVSEKKLVMFFTNIFCRRLNCVHFISISCCILPPSFSND
jgi:hypothetical protein